MDFNKIKERNRDHFRANAINIKITSLKKKLATDDYKIIKCMESYLVDKEAPLPYDIEKIAAERNAIRETINNLEEELKMITLNMAK